MEKMVKFTAKELLDSFNREFSQADINEIYKALVAWNLGYQEISEEGNKLLDKVIDFYFEQDNIRGFINDEILDYAESLAYGDNEE